MHFDAGRTSFLPWSPKRVVKAVDGVSFGIEQGKTLGLVGESGCGKSTVARVVLRLHKATSGSVFYKGTELTGKRERELRRVREKLQIIFQDPYASLEPRQTIGFTIGEPLRIHTDLSTDEIQLRVQRLLSLVGLNPSYLNRYPHEFSGGQRQRVVVARALATDPDFIVADEPVSALDVSIQAQVINLLKDLRARLGLTFLFISHDLRVVRYISDAVAVMYLGKIVELSPTEELYAEPLHPYTQALLSAVPRAKWETTGTKRIKLEGEVPSPINPPKGCYFSPRCPFVMDRCREEAPPLVTVDGDRKVACFLHGG
jgi:oligopeptide transport system ATP-binding protein